MNGRGGGYQKRDYKYLTPGEIEEAFADTAHALARVEIRRYDTSNPIALIHFDLSNGRRLTIGSTSGADLAVEEHL